MMMFRNLRQDGTKFYCLSKIPSDDVLERLYKLRIRESEQLKTVLELYEMEIHQKISMPEKVFVTSGKKKGQCSKGDRCSFHHETQDRAQKQKHTAATPFEHHRCNPSAKKYRETCRKR